MALGLAFLFGMGATLVCITLVLPHRSNTEEVGVLVAPLLAYVVCGVLLRYGRQLPSSAYYGILAAGSVLITVCVFFGGDNASAYPLLYVWVALYAFYFFPVRVAVAETIFVAVLYAAALFARDLTTVPEVEWLMTAGTILVAGTLIGRLVLQVRSQAADLAAVAEIANGISGDPDLAHARRAICAAVADSCRADAVALLEDGGGPLASVASAGSDSLADELRDADEANTVHTSGRRALIMRGRRIVGIAEPVQVEGRTAAVLVVGWHRPRRLLPDERGSAVSLFAAEASVALERARRLSRELERRALEINDNVVQGLVLAKYALAAGREEEGAKAVDETLARARDLMSEHLPDVKPGDLVREKPSSLAPSAP
jgi:K+-sensing histidine kinase KdpD